MERNTKTIGERIARKRGNHQGPLRGRVVRATKHISQLAHRALEEWSIEANAGMCCENPLRKIKNPRQNSDLKLDMYPSGQTGKISRSEPEVFNIPSV